MSYNGDNPWNTGEWNCGIWKKRIYLVLVFLALHSQKRNSLLEWNKQYFSLPELPQTEINHNFSDQLL